MRVPYFGVCDEPGVAVGVTDNGEVSPTVRLTPEKCLKIKNSIAVLLQKSIADRSYTGSSGISWAAGGYIPSCALRQAVLSTA